MAVFFQFLCILMRSSNVSEQLSQDCLKINNLIKFLSYLDFLFLGVLHTVHASTASPFDLAKNENALNK